MNQRPLEITPELQDLLLAAYRDAQRRRHEYLTLEHVLFAMTVDARAVAVLRALAVSPAKLAHELEQFFAESIDALPEGAEVDPEQTPTFRRVLERAMSQMQAAGKSEVGTGALLAAFYREPSSHAVFLLEQ